MNASKVVIAGTGVIAVIAALGFAYAQTSTDAVKGNNVTDSQGRDVTSSFGTPAPNTSTPTITEPTTNSVDQRQNTSADSSSSSTTDAIPTNQAGAGAGAAGATTGMTDNGSSDVARPTEQTSGIATTDTSNTGDTTGMAENGSSAASGNAANAAGGSTGERIARADRN